MSYAQIVYNLQLNNFYAEVTSLNSKPVIFMLKLRHLTQNQLLAMSDAKIEALSEGISDTQKKLVSPSYFMMTLGHFSHMRKEQ